jgi:unsaturated rhamnogalacturonyl hydrolase
MATAAWVLWAMLGAASAMDAEIRAVAALPGEPRIVSAAGVTRDETPILTIENAAAFDPAATRRRLVIVGGDEGDGGDSRSADAVVAAIRWFKTRAPRAIREHWTLSALPVARFEPSDTQSLSRWIAFQAPDLLVTIGGAPVRQANVPSESMAIAAAAAELQTLMMVPRARSALHDSLVARVQRDPLAIARLLARRYPETPGISYIPAVAWTQTLRLAAITGDGSLRDKVREQTRPWIAGEKKPFGDRVQLTAVAGTMIFAELAAAGDQAAAALADQGVTLAAAEKAGSVAEYGQGWTDDMFMGTSVLARAGELARDTAAHRLIAYAARLQRNDGLFNHAIDGPVAWGRGNGFAALGLMEALTRMPATHPSRATLLDIYRRQMRALLAQQAPDGMWRQIIDEAGAYREETATAMLMTAMARGVRLGWIDRSYVPAVQRAWRALAAHIVDDGTVVDVCANTGAGPTRRYYFDRPAITGPDDRGGAMALLAAVEQYEFTRPSSRRRAGSSSAARSAR